MSAYDKGYQAYYDGASAAENPFQEGSQEYNDWEDGFYTAVGEDQKEEGN